MPKEKQVWITVGVPKKLSDAISKALEDLNSQPEQVVKITRSGLIKNLLLQFLVGYNEAKQMDDANTNKVN